jgi:hypothetical protein
MRKAYNLAKTVSKLIVVFLVGSPKSSVRCMYVCMYVDALALSFYEFFSGSRLFRIQSVKTKILSTFGKVWPEGSRAMADYV